MPIRSRGRASWAQAGPLFAAGTAILRQVRERSRAASRSLSSEIGSFGIGIVQGLRTDAFAAASFLTTVTGIKKKKSQDFSTTGQWVIVTETNGKQESAVFDAVMVRVGHHIDPYPSLPLHSIKTFFPFPQGIRRSQGQYFHSRQYKHPDMFQGKRVLVVGMGNSGLDIAAEASHVAAKVTVCTGRGAWVLSHVFDHGYPWDTVFSTCFMSLIRNKKRYFSGGFPSVWSQGGCVAGGWGELPLLLARARLAQA
uniref:Flavin-containing monooxygenase n=1 Tax=Apteryx owenii TaxID=8824 RepID=A0A8B9PZW3_APTOW